MILMHDDHREGLGVGRVWTKRDNALMASEATCLRLEVEAGPTRYVFLLRQYNQKLPLPSPSRKESMNSSWDGCASNQSSRRFQLFISVSPSRSPLQLKMQSSFNCITSSREDSFRSSNFTPRSTASTRNSSSNTCESTKIVVQEVTGWTCPPSISKQPSLKLEATSALTATFKSSTLCPRSKALMLRIPQQRLIRTDSKRYQQETLEKSQCLRGSASQSYPIGRKTLGSCWRFQLGWLQTVTLWPALINSSAVSRAATPRPTTAHSSSFPSTLRRSILAAISAEANASRLQSSPIPQSWKKRLPAITCSSRRMPPLLTRLETKLVDLRLDLAKRGNFT